MTITIPPLIFWISCLAAMGVGYIVRWFLEEYTDFDFEEWVSKIFRR